MGPNEFKVFALQLGADVDQESNTVTMPVTIVPPNTDPQKDGDVTLYDQERELDNEYLSGFHYRHVWHMTSEELHSKSMIAGELAVRDGVIDLMTRIIERQQLEIARLKAAIMDVNYPKHFDLINSLKEYPNVKCRDS